jgi:hypothetical protein
VIARVIVLLLLALACSSAPSRPLSEEERLYRAKCTSCHRAYEPWDRSDWPAVLDKMEAGKKTHLTPEERAQILTFLQGTPGPAER